MVKLNSAGLLYWIGPRNFFTGQPLEYVYSVVDCKPGYATLTRHGHSITVSVTKLWDFHRGTLVQDAFPELSATDREFLITGLNPQEQHNLFKEHECTP